MIRWYYAHPKTREQMGPCDEAEVRDLFVSGTISPSTLVWHEGIAEWIPAREAFLAYDPVLGPERAAVPGRLAGWMRFDSIVLWLEAIVLLFPAPWVAIPMGVAAWWLWRSAGTLARMPSIPAESEVLLVRLRGVFAALGWAAIIGGLVVLAIVLAGLWAELSGHFPDGGILGMARDVAASAGQAAATAGPEG